MRSEKPQTHRHRRNPQSLGNFLGRVLEDVAQQARLAEIRSQLGDRGGHQLAHFAPREAFFGIVLARRHVASQRFVARTGRLFEREQSPVAPLADHVDRGVRRNARNPSVQVVPVFTRLAGKLLEPRHGLQEGILAHIFGVGRIASQPQRPQVQPRGVRQNQFSQGFAIALSRLCKQRGAGPTIKA